MILGKVVGTVVATRKDERLIGSKLLLVQPGLPEGEPQGVPLVAVDTVDAGVGETVLVVSGSSARMATGLADVPVDAAIVGIVDDVNIAWDPFQERSGLEHQIRLRGVGGSWGLDVASVTCSEE